MEKQTQVTAQVDYIHANPKGGYFQAFFNDEELAAFKLMSEADQMIELREAGSLEVMDLNVEDYGDLSDIEIHE